MTTTLSDLAEVIAAVQLEDVRLKEVVARASIREPSEAGEVQIPVQWTSVVVDHSHDEFFVELSVQTKVVPVTRPSEPAVIVHAILEVHYRLPRETEATEEALKAFAATNAVINAWPYARELVRDMSGRMHLPALTFPVLRFSDVMAQHRVSAREDVLLPPPTETKQRVAKRNSARRRRRKS